MRPTRPFRPSAPPPAASSLPTLFRIVPGLLLGAVALAAWVTPRVAVAGELDVQLSPARVATAASDSPRTTDTADGTVIVPVLLPPGEELAEVRAAFPVTALGTGFLHGHAIAHVAIAAVDLATASDRTLHIATRPASTAVAMVRRPAAWVAPTVQRSLEPVVVNPEDLSAYASSDVPQAVSSGRDRGFAPSATPSLEGSPVRMLILTHESLADAFEDYADYWTGLGVPTVVRTVEWVTANYPNGADVAETLRDFVRQAYALWGIHSLLLGGDTDLVPTRYASSVYSLEGDQVPTDQYYACLDGDWNADHDARWGEGFTASGTGDMADLIPELRVGRLPVTTPADVSALLSKLQAYVEPAVTDYQNKLLFLAEVIWPATYKPGDPIYKNGADNAERIIQQNALNGGTWEISRMYETASMYPGSQTLTMTGAIAAMGSGYGLVTDVGHGFRYTMSLGDLSMTNVNASSLTNGSRPFFLNMLNCSAAAFDFPCLAEKFLLNPGGGAIGVIGASREAYPDNIQLYQEAWFKKLYSEGFTGAADALNEARLRWVSQTYEDGAYRWSNFITNYLGDPELEVWVKSPRTASLAVPATMPIGTQDLAVTVTDGGGAPVVGARVCAWKPGDFYAVAETNRSGVATLRFAAEAPGTVQLSLAGSGVRVARTTMTVTGTPGPSLRVTGDPFVVDSGAGSTGNGNGKLDASETAFLRFQVENRGAMAADAATLQIACSEPALTVSGAPVSLGTLSSGASVLSPPIPVTVAGNALDQQQVRIDVVLHTLQGWSWIDHVDVELQQCAPAVARMWVDDKSLGNGDGIPTAGETYDLRFDLRNYGFGWLDGATGALISVDPDVQIISPVTSLGTIGHLGNASGSFRVLETSVTEENPMTLLVYDARGRSWTFPIETRRPEPPRELTGDASLGQGTVRLTWTPSVSTDVVGYVVYRATSTRGPWNRASRDLVRSATAFKEDALPGQTLFYYAVSAVDASGNESARTPNLQITTNPELLAGWPQPLGIWSNSSPVLADLDGDLHPEIVVGASDHMYAWHPDGTEVRDGDANPATTGVFTSTTANFMPGLAAADLDHDGRDEIVACTFDTKQVWVFETDGAVRAGWPRSVLATTTPGIWATPAIGDLDLDGELDIVVLGLDGKLYAWHADGTELRDGDSNPSTQGVFFVIPGSANWSRGAPAIADLLPSDATPEIIFGTENSLLYVLRADGSVAPGWPRTLGGRINAAPSLGDIDGDGALEVAVPCRDGQLYVLRADGNTQAGWPRPLPNIWNALTPSVALADFDGDGRLELVAASTGGTTEEGSLYVFDWQGNVRPGWPVDLHTASESSPIVGDLDGDGAFEIVYGGESGVLYGLRDDGTTQPGFPIRAGAEIRATPMLTDADGDSRTDLVFSGWDQQVYIWSLPGLFVLQRMPWPAFKGNLLRNGVYQYREPTDTEETAVAPRRTVLYPNVPNPFNPSTLLQFDVAGATSQPVCLAIYDARGHLVRTLLQRVLAPGRYAERWNGRDDHGHAQPSGVYFSRLATLDQSATRKLVLVR